MIVSSSKVAQKLIEQTLRELSQPQQPKARSRVWQDPKGCQYLAVWQNAALLRVLVRKFTITLPLDKTLNQPLEYRLKAQLDDAARSVKRNIEEGWKRPTTSEYLQFLGYSQASLEEVKGDIRDCKTDGFLESQPESSLGDLGFNINIFKGAGKGMAKGEPTEISHPYCQPLERLKGTDLTYEIFMELVNKTDWLLRLLVQSLEKKLTKDQKTYQIERMRVKSNLKL